MTYLAAASLNLSTNTVLIGLAALVLVVLAIRKARLAKSEQEAPAAAPAAAPEAVISGSPVADPTFDAAPGSAGQLKLYDTPPKTAAMIMAIVADKMGKPLNELRFISIKEVK